MVQFSLVGAVGLCIAILGGPSASVAQSVPSKPITIVVPFAPGGLSDVPARGAAVELQKTLGTTVIIENKPGASGVTGASSVVRAEPDGATLLATSVADVQNRHYLSVPYDSVTDFAHIGFITEGPPLVLIVNADLQIRTVAELVAAGKREPGRYSFATSGPATSPAIAVTQLNALAGTQFIEVPYRGTAPAAAAVLGGEVQAGFIFYSSAKPLVDSGKVRAIAVAQSGRLATWPEVPTMAEAGFPGVIHSGFTGLSAPKDTPFVVIAALNRALNIAIASPAFQKNMSGLGMTVPTENTSERFAAFIAAETARQGELAKLSGHAVGGKL